MINQAKKAAFQAATAKARQVSSKEPGQVPHLIIKAGPGCGKTTTLIGSVNRIKDVKLTFKPSKLQEAVIESVYLSKDARSIAIIAFSKKIAVELQKRVPAGVDASTTHSMSFRPIQKAFGRVGVNDFRVDNIISEITGIDSYDLRSKRFELLKATKELVKHCKSSLSDPTLENLESLAAFYDVDMNGSRSEVFDLVPQVIERCKDATRDNCIDFNDMIWLPIVLDLPMFKYDLLLVDESQDLSRCQQAVARKAGHRIVLCGDENQAVFGFAGADCESMNRMELELNSTPEGVQVLPLNETRRCARSIVDEANKIFPGLVAHKSNPLGTVDCAEYKGDSDKSYFSQVKEGDAVLCRVNAPLVSQCFRFLKAGRRAEILGRNVAQSLTSTIKKMKASDVGDLIENLGDWLQDETEKENRRRNPSEQRLLSLQDRHDCIICFTEGTDSVAEVITKIEDMFSSGFVCPKCRKKGNEEQTQCFQCKCDLVETTGIKLSSIHRSKGLEWNRVFLLEPKGAGVPHPLAKSAWEIKGEWCLKFVATTRAISHLTYVKERD